MTSIFQISPTASDPVLPPSRMIQGFKYAITCPYLDPGVVPLQFLTDQYALSVKVKKSS